MKQIFGFGSASLLLTASLFAADPIYINNGMVNNPQVDAIRFVNAGTFSVTSFPFPYDTQNTLFYTNLNSGLMDGLVGYRLDLATPTNRRPADTVVNRGTIDVSTYILANATNIINSGLLSVDSFGVIQLKGNNVDLTRGGLRTGAAGGGTAGLGRGIIFNDGTYVNPAGVQDIYAGVGLNGLLGVGGQPTGQGTPLNLSLLQLPNPGSGPHQVLSFPFMVTNIVSVNLSDAAAFAWTNTVSPTNFIVQTVFVLTNHPDTNFSVQVRFAPNPSFTADPNTRIAIVELSLWDIDAVIGLPVTNYAYFLDSSATTTNLILITNAVNTNFARPFTHEISRITPLPEWPSSEPGNAPFDNTLILNPAFTNAVVTNNYVAYSAQIGTVGITPAFGGIASAVGGGGFFSGLPFINPFASLTGFGNTGVADPTNMPGRVEIRADRLNIDKMRIRGEGLVTIETKDYQNLPPTKIDTPLITFDLATRSDTLILSNVVPVSVRRMEGTFNAFSAIWTNFTGMVETNATDPANIVLTTNVIEIMFHALVLDHNFQTIKLVQIRDFNMRGTNILLADRLEVTRAIEIQAESLTVSGSLLLRGFATSSTNQGVQDLVSSNLVGMKFLTNLGAINVPSLINLGADRPQPFSNIVNRGSISASGIQIRSHAFEHSGQIDTSRGPVSLETADGKLDGAAIFAKGDVIIKANDFKIRESIIEAGELRTNLLTSLPEFDLGTLFLSVTNRLTDNGVSPPNLITTLDGFQMLLKPTTGDLLGTQIRSVAPRFAEVPHIWAGENRGLDPSGFTNNSALGALTLDGQFNNLFRFTGASQNNALYVDVLELLNDATNVQTSLQIDTNITIYFAIANLPPEQLDGLFDGRLRWFSSFAGPNSSTNIMIGGQTNQVNLALLQSPMIDSDGDGIMNANDAIPFGGITLGNLNLAAGPAIAFSWVAVPQVNYQVDFSSSLTPPDWVTLTNIINNSPTNRFVTVQDLVLKGEGQRFYRVRYNP